MSSAARARLACITLDLEEDHAGLTGGALAYEGLAALPEIATRLAVRGIPLSIFVAGNLLERHGHRLEALPGSVEFHSHAYCHPGIAEARVESVRRKNIVDGLAAFEAFFQRRPLGFRAPFGIHRQDDLALLSELGVKFDSSEIPGFHLSGIRPWERSRPRYYAQSEMLELPISALFALRAPYAFSYMQLLGVAPYTLAARWGLLPDPVIFNFHLHDLVRTRARSRLSPFFRWVYGERDFADSWDSFERWLNALEARDVRFCTMSEVYERYRTLRAEERSRVPMIAELP